MSTTSTIAVFSLPQVSDARTLGLPVFVYSFHYTAVGGGVGIMNKIVFNRFINKEFLRSYDTSSISVELHLYIRTRLLDVSYIYKTLWKFLCILAA